MPGLHVWLVIQLALDVLWHGTLICGAPGTGKSLVLKAFRASLARLIARDPRPDIDIHVVDFDSKRDLYDIHRLYPNYCPVFDLNPFVWGDVFDVVDDAELIRLWAPKAIVTALAEIGFTNSDSVGYDLVGEVI